VEPSSTDDSRRQGALSASDIGAMIAAVVAAISNPAGSRRILVMLALT
jgi:hypothetical protein